eukprot:CAMPEP_0113633220 /NCGR_PEP_ID=MMETSP0017_2-20120614/17286_1 /TAXON_ID=2856 /ORGANISM="Cylindrotheca closterium" /LENGTH=97 /DNA_ID=CAMNT_0000543845 /DNA_START=192 /DNA_END=481 /DNA_ORIENTATION=+ /assembly_acc=CAM_ASM_000147
MFFRRLTPRERTLGAIGGVLVGGSIFKVAYFKWCRDILVDQANRTHVDATENYREAKEFAKWSAKDREERRASLPPLTKEQEQQMKAYLRMMQEHHA